MIKRMFVKLALVLEFYIFFNALFSFYIKALTFVDFLLNKIKFLLLHLDDRL